MITVQLPLEEIDLVALTRAMAGAGLALLVAGDLNNRTRKVIGWPLLAIGAASTIPLLIDILRRRR